MTIHHQAHRERIDAGLGFEWDILPAAILKPSDIQSGATEVKFHRIKKSHRGIKAVRGIKTLWAYAVDQDFLEEICSISSLEILHLSAVTATDLSSIKSLKNIKSLSVIGATKIKDLSWLPLHRSLQALAIENMKQVHDLTDIAKLGQLEALAIEGSMWTAMRVSSLKPLAALASLKFLFLTNLRVEDQSLKPLHNLQQLEVLQCARFCPRAES